MIAIDLKMGSGMKVAAALIFLVLLTGCQQLQFYQQAIAGQGRLLLARQPVDALLQAAETDPALKYRLALAADVIAFAEAEGLAAGGAYESYVATGQPFVIWNVFAALPYSLQLKQSCFPVAGCVSYRGYFRRDDAMAHARHLQSEGYEAYVGGVTAYSTLGWFDDPLLDTFLFRPEDDLAALLFHELAHQLVYVSGDTRFNESLATAVERFMLKKWLAQSGDLARYERYLARRARISAVISLIGETRQALGELYASGITEPSMETRKQALLAELVAAYDALAETWDEGDEYAAWMRSPINNAKLETVADYHGWVPVLLPRLEASGLEAFTREMKPLADLSQAEREKALEAYSIR
jgi:predicted aminopeptidase